GQAAARLGDELGRPPTRDEVADRLGLCRETAEMIASALRTAGTLPLRGPGEEWTEGEAFADKRSKGPDVRATEADEVRRLMDCVGQLSGREAEVLRLRFGLAGGEPRTLREIGEVLGVTRERARQIEQEALGKLRERMRVGARVWSRPARGFTAPGSPAARTA